jgi:hypothetical protein
MINSANYDDPDLAEPYYDYDQNYVIGGLNQGLVTTAGGHHLELGFGSGPTSGTSHARGS